MKRLPYKTTLHALNEAKKSQVDYSENCPDITTMDLPLWVSHVRIESPQPLEYRLQFRSDAPFGLPKRFQTLYIPRAEIIKFENIENVAPNEDEAMRYYDIAMEGLAYNHYFAGGPAKDLTNPEETHFVLSADFRLFTFAANVALLQPTYHGPEGTLFPDKKWDKVNLRLYELGGYKTS